MLPSLADQAAPTAPRKVAVGASANLANFI